MWSWSKALLMLDENSLKYRIEELSKELDNANKKLEQSQKNAEREKAAREAAEKEAIQKETQAALARIKELEQLLASKK